MQTTIRRCHCGVSDWAQLRHAIGLTQQEMADLLCISGRQVSRMETKKEHSCPRRSSLMLLKFWLDDPKLKAKVRKAGVHNPFDKWLSR
jgi:transcriptional regulator with XRE-family HTH domain